MFTLYKCVVWDFRIK